MGEKKKLGKKLRRSTSSEEISVEERLEAIATRDVGSFTFGYCTACGWQGRGRRSRDKARRDRLEHSQECAGKKQTGLASTDAR